MQEFILEVKKLIPEQNCKKIISYFDRNMQAARTTGLGDDKRVRNCDMTSVLHTSTFGEKICSNYVKKKVFECLDFYKKKYSYVNAYKISSCDILKYEHNQYKAGYTFHTDQGFKVAERSLSISICLNNNFYGGEFVFDLLSSQVQYPQNVGDALILPSNFMYPHQVNQVTKGTRYALVSWVI